MSMSEDIGTRRRRKVANPDDPPVVRPPWGPRGPMPGPNYRGSSGRIAIVQGQIFIVAVILAAQLWLVTVALFDLLSGQTSILAWLALVSFVGFIVSLIVYFWPRRRIDEGQ